MGRLTTVATPPTSGGGGQTTAGDSAFPPLRHCSAAGADQDKATSGYLRRCERRPNGSGRTHGRPVAEVRSTMRARLAGRKHETGAMLGAEASTGAILYARASRHDALPVRLPLRRRQPPSAAMPGPIHPAGRVDCSIGRERAAVSLPTPESGRADRRASRAAACTARHPLGSATGADADKNAQATSRVESTRSVGRRLQVRTARAAVVWRCGCMSTLYVSQSRCRTRLTCVGDAINELLTR